MFKSLDIVWKLGLMFIALLASPTYAQMCKYVDESGRVTYSNINSAPPKGAKKEKCFDSPPRVNSQASPSSANEVPQPENFPSVNFDKQQHPILQESA